MSSDLDIVDCICPRYGDTIYARSPRCLVHADTAAKDAG